MVEAYKRRVHSTIDKLPKELVGTITHMLIDGIWPDDYKGKKTGKPRYIDIADYVKQQGRQISEYAIGRYYRRVRSLAVMKQSAELVKVVMKAAKNEKVSETQKAVAEMLTASIINTVATKDDFSAKDLQMLSGATRDCVKVAISADKYIREQIKENIQAAAKKIDTIGRKNQIDPDTLRLIREQVYGIIDDKLGLGNKKNNGC